MYTPNHVRSQGTAERMQFSVRKSLWIPSILASVVKQTGQNAVFEQLGLFFEKKTH